MAQRINGGLHNANNEFGNYVEYCVEKRSEGKYRRNRFLLVLICVLVAVSIIPVVTFIFPDLLLMSRLICTTHCLIYYDWLSIFFD